MCIHSRFGIRPFTIPDLAFLFLILLFFFICPRYLCLLFFGTYTLSRLDIGTPSPFHVHSFL